MLQISPFKVVNFKVNNKIDEKICKKHLNYKHI